MLPYSLAFLSGVLLLQNLPSLPQEKWVWLSVIFSSILLYCPYKIFKIPAVIALGFAWCLWFAHMQTRWALPNDFEGKTITVTGYIASIPAHSEQMTEFLFSIKQLQLNHHIQSAHGLLHLSWRSLGFEKLEKKLHVGDQWQLNVRLKKIHGNLNPGGFDYEAHALQQGIRATGYVMPKLKNILLSTHWYSYPIDRVREMIKIKIENHLPLTQTSPWIVALTVGERNGIDEANWEVLRNTGTNHLMAIAGLHIGFMTGFSFVAIGWLWRRHKKLSLRFPAQLAGAVASLCVGLLYSALAGFSIPTQRACIMITFFLLIILQRRHARVWQAWSMALVGVLLLNPLSVLTDSFWLSFGAVAFIIYGMRGRLAPQGWWWKIGRIQWLMAVGLIPLGIWLFQQFSLVSFFANSIAIPWVGFLVVPLCLLGSLLLNISTPLGTWVLILADKILGVLWLILTWFAHLSWGSWYLSIPNYWALGAAILGMVFLLMPIGMPGRYIGLIWLLPLFCYKISTPKRGDVWFTLLDVGQGLSAVVQTEQHILVFDAGPKLNANYDMGASVVVPFLRSLRAKQVDMLVISHGDNDHIGGAPAILKQFLVKKVKTSVPKELPMVSASYCLRGEEWNWDNVNFKFLYPTEHLLGFDNDSSCVLKVTSGSQHILLTGDIEKFAEHELIKTEEANLAADILVAPHHGSKTSAVDAFLADVHPRYVLFPIGYRNRYHFPHEEVIEKYNALHTIKIDTVAAGAITFKISQTKLIGPLCYRQLQARYWR